MVVQLRKEEQQLLPVRAKGLSPDCRIPVGHTVTRVWLKKHWKKKAACAVATHVCVAPALEIPSVFEYLLWLSLVILKATEEKLCYYFKMCRLHLEDEEAKDKFHPENGLAFCVNRRIKRSLLETASELHTNVHPAPLYTHIYSAVSLPSNDFDRS